MVVEKEKGDELAARGSVKRKVVVGEIANKAWNETEEKVRSKK